MSKVELSNGSVIETLESSRPKRGQRRELITIADVIPEDVTTAILGLDIAKPPYDKSDLSALSIMCGNCKTIIQTELFVGEVLCKEAPKVCSECGVVFTNSIIAK